jgi:predicted DNA-binding transcriptional regulator AlpA
VSSVPQLVRRRLKTQQAADYLGLGVSTLEKFRVFGGGPVYEKLGRSVVYDVEDLERWAASRKRSNTSQAA